MSLSAVMVVDDSETDQYLAKLVFAQIDPRIQVLQAYDGQEALEILAGLDEQPQVIILDINMPRMNGHEFLVEYAARDEHVIVVMLSSSRDARERQTLDDHPSVKRFYSKPLSHSVLEDIIQLAESQIISSDTVAEQ